MAKVTSFNKANIKNFRADLEAELDKIGAKFGVKIDLGGIRYNEKTIQCKDFAIVINSGEVADPIMADVSATYIQALIKWRGQAAVKKAVKIGGKDAVIVGIKGKSYIFKYTNPVDVAKAPGLRRISFHDFDDLDQQVRGIKLPTLQQVPAPR